MGWGVFGLLEADKDDDGNDKKDRDEDIDEGDNDTEKGDDDRDRDEGKQDLRSTPRKYGLMEENAAS